MAGNEWSRSWNTPNPREAPLKSSRHPIHLKGRSRLLGRGQKRAAAFHTTAPQASHLFPASAGLLQILERPCQEFNVHSDPDSDPAGRPEFSHGVQMDSKRIPPSKSGIFLQRKTAVERTSSLRGRAKTPLPQRSFCPEGKSQSSTTGNAWNPSARHGRIPAGRADPNQDLNEY